MVHRQQILRGRVRHRIAQALAGLRWVGLIQQRQPGAALKPRRAFFVRLLVNRFDFTAWMSRYRSVRMPKLKRVRPVIMCHQFAALPRPNDFHFRPVD